jgi:hypothetical protein
VNSYAPYGNDQRGYAVVSWQGATSAPADLRERAALLIETHDEAAALRAAELYLQEADRVFAQASYQFSQAKRLISQLARDGAQLAADQSRLARAQADVDQQRQALEEKGQELALALALEILAARQEALEAMENEPVQKKCRRRQADGIPAPSFPDSGPLDLRPNPGAVRSADAFLQCLLAFRMWTGNRSLRQISELSGGRISASGARNVLNGNDVPSRLEVVDAIIQGCGGSDEDRAAFAAAWRRLYVRPPR